jgi:hypothetical protein
VVVPLGLDPLLFWPAGDRPLALLGLAEVEPVPEQAAGVDGVAQDVADRDLRPLAGRVAAGVDVAGRRRPAGPVEVVGDLLVAPAGEVPLEGLDDDGRPLGIGDEPGLRVAGAGPPRVGVRLVLKPVAIGGAAAVAVALAGVFGLATADFAAELLDLELVERLEHVADQAPFGGGLVARGEGVEDLHTRAGELALVGERAEEVAAQPRSSVDQDGVEAARVALLRLADEVAPAGAVVAAARVLVGELGGDPSAELLRLGRARLALGRKGEGGVLLVFGG